MPEFNDHQHFTYPPAYPPAPYPPAPLGPIHQPVGDSGYHTMVVSSIGQGPAGPRGEAASFEDFTDDQISEIAKKTVLYGNKSTEGTYVTTAGSTQYVSIPIDGYTNYDMLFVDINGLDLIEGEDYTVLNNGSIKLTTPIQGAGNEIHFRALSYESTDGKYVTIAPTLADPIDWSIDNVYNEYTVVRHDNVSYISKQPVPAGIQITNGDYWQVWSDANELIDELREDIDQVAEDLAEGIADLSISLTKITPQYIKLTAGESKEIPWNRSDGCVYLISWMSTTGVVFGLDMVVNHQSLADTTIAHLIPADTQQNQIIHSADFENKEIIITNNSSNTFECFIILG